MRVYKPHHSIDGPNPKLIQPWRGPYIICSKLSPVVYRIRHPDDTKQVSVHLDHIKSYRSRQSAPAPYFHKLEGLFLGKTLPTPALEESETVQPHIGILLGIVALKSWNHENSEKITGTKRGYTLSITGDALSELKGLEQSDPPLLHHFSLSSTQQSNSANC